MSDNDKQHEHPEITALRQQLYRDLGVLPWPVMIAITVVVFGMLGAGVWLTRF